jgi:hypothetical protein
VLNLVDSEMASDGSCMTERGRFAWYKCDWSVAT